MKALVIAGTASGVGKTTVATGLIAALARRGLKVQPFKVGPDYIDPSYHARAAGRPSRNLDSWMLGPDVLRELFARAAGGCDVAVVEGVMGLYDGKSGGGEIGSTAHVAKLIGAPVVLVVDAAKSARSAAAVALGFRALDPELDLAGVILNNVASPGHYAAAAEPIEREAGLPVLGQLRRDSSCHLDERYLGLVPTAEGGLDDDRLGRLASLVADGVDVPRLLELASRAHPYPEPALGLFPSQRLPRNVRIAVARDAAFNFYYQDNLDLLEAWGAELLSFSPLRDARLPADASAVYIGGGFPELFAPDLARNASLLADLRRSADEGMPIYAECGGLMYLADGLTDQTGRRHQMVGVLPGWSTLEGGRITLGYHEVAARRDSILLDKGDQVRGHEFHWSRSEPADAT
ncbi:MAG: cobyrinate a,c-diamide synthase, partial [Chloroflexi bacterium]|nr:cobyrinate a,c-diamide synthase [Chloroflexota bacterium]